MKYITAFILLLLASTANAQQSGIITVNGDITKYYPVTFQDGGWLNNAATELEIGRSDVHSDEAWAWRGSIIARFRYHVTNYGHNSNFIDADIRQYKGYFNDLVAGWKDATLLNSNNVIIIWLRGNTTYNYKSNYAVNPTVFDGVQNALPYKEMTDQSGFIEHSYKTTIDATVNSYGLSYENTAYFNGLALNYFAGSIGIGTVSTGDHKLAVEGSIGARRVKVTQTGWADFVFGPDYRLPPLWEVEQYIRNNQHLPEIPSAAEVEKDGLDLGEMNRKLLQKVEELTLYLIDLQKQVSQLQQQHEQLKKKVMMDSHK